MKKLTKDQKYYRKLKKDGKKDIRYTDKPEKGKFFRHVRVTRKPLSVRVKLEAYEKLQQLSEKLERDKWDVLSHIILVKLPRYAGYTGGVNTLQRYSWDVVEPAEKIKYKGSTGVKQLTYYITSTAWNKLDIHKKAVGQSKARIVQSLIMDYKPCTPATLARAKKLRDGYQETNNFYKAKQAERQEEEREYRSTSKLYIDSNYEIKHKLGFPMDKWFEEEFDQYMQLAPIANELIKKRQYNYYRSLGNTEEEAKEKVKEDKMLKEIEESYNEIKEVEEREEEEIDLWEAKD